MKHAAEQKFEGGELIEFVDVGSGLNFKRKGLRSLLERVMQGGVEVVMVAYRGMLCRFGFELIDWICSKHGAKVMVLHSAEPNTTESLTENLLAVVTVFSARAHGMRQYKRTLEKEFGDEEPNQEVCSKKRKVKTYKRADIPGRRFEKEGTFACTAPKAKQPGCMGEGEERAAISNGNVNPCV